LADHPITEGIDEVWTFTGQAFDIPEAATSILTFDEGYTQLLPDEPWEFKKDTPFEKITGLSQGAVMPYGAGKVAMFGEAAMFTAQLAGAQQRKIGFTHPDATDNWAFILNVLYWLAE
jgi:hypothetical protein